MPNTSGWTLHVTRLRTEKRAGQARARTIGRYQVLRNGVPVSGPSMSGATIEREGPGDNGPIGKEERRCIEAGTYPLAMHDTENYSTTNFETDGDNPRPAFALRQTGDRTAILVHPASGYGSTIGCFNLGDRLDDANSDLDLLDSTQRVLAVIKDMKNFTGSSFPASGAIPNCRVVVTDPPLDQIGSQTLRIGSRGPLVKAWQAFLLRQGHSTEQPDGRFSTRTVNATRKFQQANGLGVDGKVGPSTLTKARTLGFDNFGAAAPAPVVGTGPEMAVVNDASQVAAITEAARRIETSISRLIQLMQSDAGQSNAGPIPTAAPIALPMAADPQLVAAAGPVAVSIGLSSAQRLICERIINVFETGSINGDPSNISIFHDGPHGIRQITYGRAQTTEYGNLAELVKMYIDAGGTFGAELRPFLPLISHTALVDNADFKRLLRRAGLEDPIMAKTQDAFFDKRYFQRAQKWAVDNGFNKALSMLVIYDSFIHSGSILPFLRSRFPERPPSRGGNEQEWIRQYVNVRHDWLATHSNTILRNTIYRTRDFKREIGRNNWDLTILPISANGTLVTAAPATGSGGMGIAESAIMLPGEVPYLGVPSPADAGTDDPADETQGPDGGGAHEEHVHCEDHPKDAIEASAALETPAQLAARILASTAITLGTSHVSGVVDQANARQNMVDTAAGNPAQRSSYGNAPGGTVRLDRRMLSGLIRIAQDHTFAINELCGASHSPTSRHYAGIAFDIGVIDGRRVRAGHPSVQEFMALCRALGATEVLGPGNAGHAGHVHVAWPRI